MQTNRLMNGIDEYYCLRTLRLCIVTRDYPKICGSVCRIAHLANTQIMIRYYYINCINIVCHFSSICLLLASCACDETLRTIIGVWMDRSNCILVGVWLTILIHDCFGGYGAIYNVVQE